MNLNTNIIKILNKRGYNEASEIEEYISSKPQRTYDPFLLLNMEEGVDLVLSTIKEKRRICIYGDYDSDGVTSTTIMLEVLSNLTDNLSYYIPSRFDEGYGLNCDAMDKIKDAGVDLIITVDCGSVSVDEVKYAESLGLKVIVTDHHKVSDKIAECILINPTQPNCKYPFKALAGCGVAFKFCQALINRVGLSKQIYNDTLDLVAVGTIGDIVPLIDENRTLVKYGLRLLNSRKRKALDRLITGINLTPGEVKAYNVSFGIVPHINAAGRIKEAKLGVQLLRATTDEDMISKVDRLKECNSKRRAVQEETFDECLAVIEELYYDDDFFVIELPDAHEGITGIVAGKVKDLMKKPTIIVTPTDDMYYKGTGRTAGSVDLYSMLKENEELFTRFGGHKAACGFMMKMDDIDLLRENLNRQLRKAMDENPEILSQNIVSDLKLEIRDITNDFVEELEVFEPCGSANPKPIIEVHGAISNLRSIGSDNQYRSFSLEGGEFGNIECVAFRNIEMVDKAADGRTIRVFGSPTINRWKGRETIKMTVDSVEVL